MKKEEGPVERIWLRNYDPGVPATLEYPQVPLFRLLEESARRFPNRPAVVLVGPGFSSTLTFRRLDDLANRFANALISLGVRPRDRIALQLPNLPQFVFCFYGALKAGAAVVPINPLHRGRDLATQLGNSGAKVVVTISRLLPHLGEVFPETAVDTIIVTEPYDYFPFLWKLLARVRTRREKRVGGGLRLTDLLRVASPRSPNLTVDPEEMAVLQYTGGTTGIPKGAMLTHRNLVTNVMQMRRWLADLRDGEERFLAVVPFFHVYGLTVALNLPIALSSSVICVLMAMFEARQVAEAIARYRPTLFPGAPAVYVALNQLKDIKRYNLSSITVCVSGSASLPAEVQAEFERLTGARVVEGYGLTEASPATHVNPVHGMRKTGSIGLPLPDTEAKIVDPETGDTEMPLGGAGEMLIRGPQVMKGYWSAPEETAATLTDGWLHTGDIARMDEDGFFYIADRKKDLVIVGGLKVYPREIEEFLHEHPKVKEAAVVGIPHKVRGELLIAHVVLKEGADGDPRAVSREILEFCRSRLAPYKVPRRVRITTALPKTPVGKVLKRDIRAAEIDAADQDG
jgi:long-chain acyl-CoA synthetase